MELRWTSKALSDLARLREFLADVSPQAAAQLIRSLTAATRRLKQFPQLGRRLTTFEPRQVRRMIVGRYEVRYEIRGEIIYVLRIWHTREDR